MSSVLMVPVVRVTNLREHPNASLLGLADVLGYQMVLPLVEDPDGDIVRSFVKGVRDEKGKRVAYDPATCGYVQIEDIHFRHAYEEGELAVYFPADTLLPSEWVDKFGVRSLMKGTDQNRVGRVRLRGEPSFGLVVSLPEGNDWAEGDNVAEYYGAVKYEPPLRVSCGDAAPYDPDIDPHFFKFTDIQNGRIFTDVLKPGEEVIFTEKIHGTNCRVGIIGGNLVAGSMEVRRSRPAVCPANELTNEQMIGMRVKKTSPKPFKSGNKVNTVKGIVDHPEPKLAGIKAFTFEEDDSVVECRRCIPENHPNYECDLDSPEVKANTYWFPFSLKGVFPMLVDARKTTDPVPMESVILYGEVYGGSVQSLAYGIPKGKGLGFRVFALSVNGRYLDWDELVAVCQAYGVETVPVVYRGPFSMEIAKQYADGTSTMSDHMREGIVAYPVKERIDPKVGRAVLKFIGTEYELSKHKERDNKDV